ncbi:DUF1858 domain-containing protein [Desulforamulus aeronauticus]|uniref:DUF1858 domain-containing protein n=1 Tax=Desulforamulus aeronauticus DSM 10349 TaxID=1121421 RepID=A0A1M6P2B8_9FIRM|nr:DUF1858 domain-containing protein [Desulforamulus aeronauticus]SHK02076.1 protein of unknown function [Desulforamulus aeronauticus DSM 10349]
MNQSVDFRKTIYELVKENPEVANIMQEIGFKDITNPAMLNTAGRVMTIPKGASMKKIDLNTIKQIFRDHGFEVVE